MELSRAIKGSVIDADWQEHRYNTKVHYNPGFRCKIYKKSYAYVIPEMAGSSNV
jgi:hypothetical protein